jgi:maltose/moltooligosaccharide transporter
LKLDSKKILFVGLAFFLISIFWQVYDITIPKILMYKFGLNHTVSGVIMAVDNILALTLLPLFGALSDRSNHKLGRRTPFVIVGTILAAFAFMGLTFSDNYQLQLVEEAGVVEYVDDLESLLPAGEVLTETQLREVRARAWDVTVNNPVNIVIFSGMLLIVLISMSTFRSPAVALMPDVTVKPLRSKANAIINLMGGASGALALVLMMVYGTDSTRFNNNTLLFFTIAAIMLISLGIFLWKVNEPKLVKQMEEDKVKYGIVDEMESTTSEKLPKEQLTSLILILTSIFLWFMGYNAVTSKFSVYAKDILNMGATMPLMIANVAAILTYIPAGIVATKVGRKKTIMFGVVLMVISFGSAFFLNPSSSWLMYVVLLLAGVGWASINVNSYPMIAELSKGSNVGKYTGYYYTFSMSAQAITPVISGILMDLIDPRILFPYGAFFIFLAFFTMIMVKHGNSKPIPQKVVEYLGTDD